MNKKVILVICVIALIAVNEVQSQLAALNPKNWWDTAKDVGKSVGGCPNRARGRSVRCFWNNWGIFSIEYHSPRSMIFHHFQKQEDVTRAAVDGKSIASVIGAESVSVAFWIDHA